MPIQFNNIREDLFSRGIDAHSAENQISEGFVRDSLNADTVQKYVAKRTGLAGFAGNLPVRVEQVEYDNAANEICFTLNSAIDLLSIRSTPIVVSGRLSAAIGTTGPFYPYNPPTTIDTSKYYPGFIQNTRQTFETGTHTLQIPGTVHGLGTWNMFAEVSESLSSTNLGNKLVDYTQLTVDTTNNDIDIDYTNGTAADIPVFTYYSAKDPAVGSVYVGAGVGSTHTLFPNVNSYASNDSGDLLIDTGVISTILLNQPVTFSLGSGTAPSNITFGTQYYAIPAYATYIKIASTVGGPPIPYVDSGAGGFNTTLDTIHISATQHQLSNYQIVARCYMISGAYRILVDPDSLTIDTATGLVTVTITNNTGFPQNYYVILSAAPAVQFRQGIFSPGPSTYTITLLAPDSPFIFPGIYLDDGSGTLEQVMPDEVAYDPVLDQISVTFENTTSANGFHLYWEYGTIRSNTLCVSDDTMDASGVDNNPQLTLWGLDHSEIWSSDLYERGGWTHHLDSYRIAGEQRVVAANSGVLYTARTFAENGISHLYGSGYPRLFGRVSGTTVLAPAFWGTGEIPGRSRGYITGDDLDDSWGTITAVSYDAGFSGGTVRVDMPVTNLSLRNAAGTSITIDNTNLQSIISTDDDLTLQGMSYSRHNGTFRIKQATVTGSTISLWLDIPAVDSPDWDDSGCAGLAGIFTDKVSLQVENPFVAGDVLRSDAVDPTLDIRYVRGVTGSTVAGILSGITTINTLQSGVQITGSRVSSVLLMRDGNDDPSVLNIVRGDILVQSGTELPLRVQFVNPNASVSVSLTGDGEIATATIADTTALRAGARILILHAGDYSGEIEISEVTSDTQFTFASTATAAETGTLIGCTVELGEPIEWADSTGDTNTFDVTHRFIPVEAPDDAYSLTPSTRQYYFDSNSPADQPFLRSTMVQDNLYLTNGDDEVMKFDGVNLYRAGLPNWQPGVFIQQDTTSSTPIVIVTNTATVTGLSIPLRTFTVTEEEAVFRSGDRVKLFGAADVTTIKGSKTLGGTTTYSLTAEGSMNGATVGVVTATAIYTYYYRLEAVDLNGNIVSSAIAQSEDYKIELGGNAAVVHRLTGLPMWDIYDYDRLYVRVFRSIANSTAAYYPVTQQRIPYTGIGYIDITDSFSDVNIQSGTPDPINLLKGGELGVGWTAPPRAKHITTAGGALLLGNIRGFSQLNIQLFGDSTVTPPVLNGNTLEFQRDTANPVIGIDPQNRLVYQWTTDSWAASTTNSTSVAGSHFAFELNVSHTTPVAGDWVYYDCTDPSRSYYNGWWRISTSTPLGGSNFAIQINTPFATALNARNNSRVYFTDTAGYIPIPMPVAGIPLYSGGQVNGNTTQTLFQAARRLSLAINVTNRALVNYDPNFTPWLMARGGNDVGVAGLIQVTQPKFYTEIMSTRWTGTGYSVFINNIQRASTEEVAAETPLFPSRVLVSYPNYPEIFDNIYAALDSQSDSAIDVNPSDGQEITGMIPFFGEAAFGSSQQSAVVVVFKQSSIYLVDINQKRAGQNPVQRIESGGVGCTFPNSIAATKGGIIFAHDSGIYILRRNLTVEYIGKFMSRNWKRTERNRGDEIHATNHTLGQKYKLSIPMKQGPDEVFVYDHTNEQEAGGGSWGRWNNHDSVGWCNLGLDAYVATRSGRVMVLRRRGDKYDFQDDHEAIDFHVHTRPLDFGAAGIRKAIDSITGFYRTEFTSNTTVGLSVDTAQEYDETTPVLITKPVQSTGISDIQGKDIDTIKHSMKRKRGVQFSLTISNNERLEGVELAGIDFRVGLLGQGQGLREASETGSKKK